MGPGEAALDDGGADGEGCVPHGFNPVTGDFDAEQLRILTTLREAFEVRPGGVDPTHPNMLFAFHARRGAAVCGRGPRRNAVDRRRIFRCRRVHDDEPGVRGPVRRWAVRRPLHPSSPSDATG